MRQPWQDCRQRLKNLIDGRRFLRVGIVVVTKDALPLYETRVGLGGEGIILR